MVKLRLANSYLIESSADWHRYKNSYTFRAPFYLEEDFWREVQEYESFDYDSIEEPPKFENNEDLNKWMAQTSAVQKMNRLIERARGMVWQFNATLEPVKVEFPEENTYVRQVSFFAKRTIQKVTKLDELVLFPYLKTKIAFMNFFITLYNNWVWFNALGPIDAIRAMERGLVVGSLDIGARKVLYKKENGQLMEKWPFYEGIENSDLGQWKPVDNMAIWIVDFEIVEEK